MRRDKGMTPQMIMEHINKNYKDAIYVTDVGQHQMWATQYLELDSNSQLLTWEVLELWALVFRQQ